VVAGELVDGVATPRGEIAAAVVKKSGVAEKSAVAEKSKG
jgi:hypothetical protein